MVELEASECLNVRGGAQAVGTPATRRGAVGAAAPSGLFQNGGGLSRMSVGFRD